MSYHPVSNEDIEELIYEHDNRKASSNTNLNTVRAYRQETCDRLFKLITLLLLITLCILVTIDLALWRQQQHSGNSKPWSIHREYGSDSRYMSLDHKYDNLWSEEIDARNALIYLSPNDTSADTRPEVGSISMFHQLHCLTSFREALQRAAVGEDIGMDWRDDVHWPHCLHYLGQSILCFADATIERGPIINVTRSTGIDRAHDVRSCRDSDALCELRMRHGVVSADESHNESHTNV